MTEAGRNDLTWLPDRLNIPLSFTHFDDANPLYHTLTQHLQFKFGFHVAILNGFCFSVLIHNVWLLLILHTFPIVCIQYPLLILIFIIIFLNVFVFHILLFKNLFSIFQSLSIARTFSHSFLIVGAFSF